jgi:ZIP family zinc transporter
MNPELIVFGLGLIPTCGNFLGSVLAELLPTSKRGLSLALHAAAGIVLGIVVVEIVSRALAVPPGWAMVVAFVTRCLFFIGADTVIGIVRRRLGREGCGGVAMIYFAVAVDLLSDGLMIGAGSAVASDLALLLALGQVAADIPEGYAEGASLGRARARRVGYSTPYALSTAFKQLRGISPKEHRRQARAAA